MKNGLASYNPKLREWMGADSSGKGIVLNRNFFGWESFLRLCLSGSDQEYIAALYNKLVQGKKGEVGWYDVRRFVKGKFKGLLKYCKEHSSAHDGHALRKDVLFVVHPLYMHIMNYDYMVGKHQRRQGEEYFTRMKGALMWANDADISVVLMDTPQHYAAVTSLWAEQGLVHKTVFSMYDSGFPLKDRDLKALRKRGVHICGGYNGLCISDAIKSTASAIDGKGKISVVRDLVVERPDNYQNFIDPMAIKTDQDVEIITLDHLVNKVEGRDIGEDYFPMPEAQRVKVC